MSITIIPTRTSADPNSASDINSLMLNDYDLYNSMASLSGTKKQISFCFKGLAYVLTKVQGAVMATSGTFGKAYLYSDVAPTNTLAVDINKNGTTIFTTQTKRPMITAGNNSDESDTPDVLTFAKGDRITWDIDSVGTATAGGNDLMLTIPIIWD